ncbi:MAG: hypothetical protein ACI9YM_000919 [Brevundimonas sp.]|jgi:hypothetical protein
MDLIWSARDWLAANFFVLSPLFFVGVILTVVLPGILVSLIEDRLPDPHTGFRRSDAVPLTPPAYLRFLAFIFSQGALDISGSGGRFIVRLLRVVLVVVYSGLFVGFVALSSEGFEFDPGADILRTDMQRSVDATSQTGS